MLFVMVFRRFITEPNGRKYETVRFNLQQQVVHRHVQNSNSQQERSIPRENPEVTTYNLLSRIHRSVT